MPIFVRLIEKDRKKLFHLVKENINSSWKTFYPPLKISRSMFFNYLSGKYNLPKELFLKLEEIASFQIENYQEIERNRFIRKKVPKVRMDKNLAEIFGVLNGDGHISNINHEICVVGNSQEKDYALYLKNLFEKKFKIPFVFSEESTRFKIRTYSIDLSNVLNKEYGLPRGNKMGKLKIPPSILSSKQWMTHYLRGLFDTDGTFYLRRGKDPVIEISSADENFLSEIKFALESLGFKVSKGKNHLSIYRKEDIIEFFKKIKPANTKHLKKYQNYLILNKRR